ncbi:hypothetical protein GCM10023153_00310 [Ornithinibacter aureus]|uniref:Conjugal transfer protein n=1 Tax=Ornithinibacter aureus TaxID=622664 RepID=A0ABP8J8H8_9MICO|nr:hypothetical protein [Ornithinibacter aureus]KAF0833850.1 hypothetical protein C8E84_1652 [Ornithinibacter aureus]
MQQSRRTTPYPYTWEIPLTATITVVLTLVLAAHTARTMANVFAGAGWDFTPHAALFTALPGILDGDARAGLDPGASASPALLYTCLVLVEVVTVILIVWAVIAGMRQWGPARVRGMASRAEADTLLGVGRLRKVAPVVRPDLHGKGDRR